MKKLAYLLVPSLFLVVFVVWTVLVKVIDVQYVGAAGFLGFYSLNTQINDFVQSQNTELFNKLTDVLMYIAISTLVPFAVVGLVQLIKRKDLKKVDSAIYIILAGYVAMVVIYLAFEIVKINYSPLSTAEELKASYPSSHVMIYSVMMGAAVLGLLHFARMHDDLKLLINIFYMFSTFGMAALRLLSGQHYFTDIIGALLVSYTILFAVNSLYRYSKNEKTEEENND